MFNSNCYIILIIWSTILKSNWVSVYLAENERKKELREFSSLQTFCTNNLYSHQNSIVWDFEEELRYKGTILWLQEKENYIEIFFEDLTVEDYEGNIKSKSEKTYIRVSVNKVRLDLIDDEE